MGKMFEFNGKAARTLMMFMMLLMLAAFNAGCDALEDDDDSDGGAGAAATAATTAAEAQDAEKTVEAEATEPEPEPEPEPAAPTTAAGNYPQMDGKGILWKPVSEGNHNLVILLATYYGAPGVSVLDANLKVIEAGNYVGHTNGNRATYRFGRQGGAFPNPSYLQIGGTIYVVNGTSSRHD